MRGAPQLPQLTPLREHPVHDTFPGWEYECEGPRRAGQLEFAGGPPERKALHRNRLCRSEERSPGEFSILLVNTWYPIKNYQTYKEMRLYEETNQSTETDPEVIQRLELTERDNKTIITIL